MLLQLSGYIVSDLKFARVEVGHNLCEDWVRDIVYLNNIRLRLDKPYLRLAARRPTKHGLEFIAQL